ncbi:MAG: hypothetical protein COT73_03835 [Bdellovibrio sp. CG10_big_fil_rev_8_21_14_0_10_47_8]|nr:MAG: hypothetical protein COT73_03835 [Bdellovibrio sp. CG10_big_fil_rev_8_21_14_0_10_47_8]
MPSSKGTPFLFSVLFHLGVLGFTYWEFGHDPKSFRQNPPSFWQDFDVILSPPKHKLTPKKAMKSSPTEILPKETLTKTKQNNEDILNLANRTLAPVSFESLTKAPHLLHEVKAAYPEEARLQHIEGVVVMAILIDQQGKVARARIQSGPGGGLNEAALAAIENFLFSPAWRGDERVPVEIIYKYRFQLAR